VPKKSSGRDSHSGGKNQLFASIYPWFLVHFDLKIRLWRFDKITELSPFLRRNSAKSVPYFWFQIAKKLPKNLRKIIQNTPLV
jgi:hypothetical protein